MVDKHEEFLKALRNLLNSESDVENVKKVQIEYGDAQFIYLSKEEPPYKIRHALGSVYETWKRKDPETGWWTWSF